MKCIASAALAFGLFVTLISAHHSSSAENAPDEYYLIESTNPKIRGYDDAVMSYVEYLYELGK